MGIRDHLMTGEMVVFEHPPFYLTSRRILRLEEKDGRDDLKHLFFEGLVSVELVKLPRHPVMVGGTVMAITGVVLWATGSLPITSFLAIAGGIAVVIFGGMGKPSYYQFHAQNLLEDEERLWRLDYWGSGNFISKIRNIIGERSEQ